MPIRAYLDGHRFGGELIRLMGIAFEMALGSFGATPAHDDPIRAALAQRIIAQAQAGERDPERLCDAALKAASPRDPLPKSRTMDWNLIDITVRLRDHRQLIDGSIIRLARSAEIQNQMQQRIRASVALMERVRALNWSMNAPILPKWTATLLAQKNTFESKNESSPC
jgi:hypothetical protein